MRALRLKNDVTNWGIGDLSDAAVVF